MTHPPCDWHGNSSPASRAVLVPSPPQRRALSTHRGNKWNHFLIYRNQVPRTATIYLHPCSFKSNSGCQSLIPVLLVTIPLNIESCPVLVQVQSCKNISQLGWFLSGYQRIGFQGSQLKPWIPMDLLCMSGRCTINYIYICIYVYMYICIYICVYMCIDIYSPIVALSFFQGPWVTTISLISAGVNQETEPSRSKDLST